MAYIGIVDDKKSHTNYYLIIIYYLLYSHARTVVL